MIYAWDMHLNTFFLESPDRKKSDIFPKLEWGRTMWWDAEGFICVWEGAGMATHPPFKKTLLFVKKGIAPFKWPL